MISNDTKLEPISLEFDIENLFYDFCVGVWVCQKFDKLETAKMFFGKISTAKAK